MARKLWVDRIGEEKTVNGYRFTIIDIVGTKVEVRANGKNFIVSRDVWNRGVFSKELKQLNPTDSHISELVGEEKIVRDVLFTIIGVMKDKVKVVADGCEHIFVMGKKTWDKGVFRNVFSDIKKLKLIVKKIVEKVIKTTKEKYEIMIHPLWQQVYAMDENTRARKNMWTDGYEYTVKDFDYCESMSELKDVYRKLAKQYHPDMPNGDREKFELMQVCYEFAKASLEGLDDLLAEFM